MSLKSQNDDNSAELIDNYFEMIDNWRQLIDNSLQLIDKFPAVIVEQSFLVKF